MTRHFKYATSKRNHLDVEKKDQTNRRKGLGCNSIFKVPLIVHQQVEFNHTGFLGQWVQQTALIQRKKENIEGELESTQQSNRQRTIASAQVRIPYLPIVIYIQHVGMVGGLHRTYSCHNTVLKRVSVHYTKSSPAGLVTRASDICDAPDLRTLSTRTTPDTNTAFYLLTVLTSQNEKCEIYILATRPDSLGV